EADRRLPRRGLGAAGAGGLPADGVGRHLPRALPRATRPAGADPRRKGAALPLGAANGEPRLPARAPGDGAGAVHLVPALRPEPADVRRQHLLGKTGRLPEGDAARVPRPGKRELHRAPRLTPLAPREVPDTSRLTPRV